MTGSLQIKSGKYYAVLRINGKQKWINLNIDDKKGNKRKAEQALNETIMMYSENPSMVDKTGFIYASNAFTAYADGLNMNNWFSDLFLTYGCLVYIAIALSLVVSIVLKKTRVGLSLRAVGESPATADAAGINVEKYKYCACVLGAAIAGLGGLFYIMDYLNGSWEYSIDAMGWLAIALVIFSLWRPNWGILGSILFGALYIAPNYLNISFTYKELLKIIPFVVTIIILIITSIVNKKETQPPAALGLSYFREER